MALKNYLTDGTYSIVDSVHYSKQSNYLRFNFRIFVDSTKQVEIAAKYYEMSRNRFCRNLKGFLSTPPENALVGDFYCVKKDTVATGAWESREGLLAVLNIKKEWEFWMLGPNEIFYFTDNGKYYSMNNDTLEILEVFPLDEYRLWDKWFSPTLLFSESNMYKQIYNFLKTRQGFEKVIDA
jgi:hypothetical protein